MRNWRRAHIAAMSICMTVLLGACSTTASRQPPIASTTTTTAEGGSVITSEMIGRSRATMSISKPAADPTYGYSEANPVKIGGGFGGGVDRVYQYLNALRGPNGEALRYDRVGSCCSFKTSASPFGEGLLDVFTVTYPGLDQPRRLYFNWWEESEAMVPVGLTAAK